MYSKRKGLWIDDYGCTLGGNGYQLIIMNIFNGKVINKVHRLFADYQIIYLLSKSFTKIGKSHPVFGLDLECSY